MIDFCTTLCFTYCNNKEAQIKICYTVIKLIFLMIRGYMKKILIVDDEQDIVESLKFVLENCNYTCYCAYNGEDGLKLAREIIPDLIILDVMMPRINGFKISRLLKFDNKYKNIPILMVTARSQEEDKLIGEETGADEYITKPFDLDDVVKTVQKYLDSEN